MKKTNEEIIESFRSYKRTNTAGFTNKELAILCEQSGVDVKKLNEEIGVVTVMLINNESVIYEWDVMPALHRTLTGEKQHPLAWD